MKNRQTFKQKMDEMLPVAWEAFKLVAYEMTREREGGWSVNTPFSMGSGVDRDEAIEILSARWEIFKLNYSKRARVRDIQDVGDENCELEVDCIAFARVEEVKP